MFFLVFWLCTHLVSTGITDVHLCAEICSEDIMNQEPVCAASIDGCQIVWHISCGIAPPGDKFHQQLVTTNSISRCHGKLNTTEYDGLHFAQHKYFNFHTFTSLHCLIQWILLNLDKGCGTWWDSCIKSTINLMNHNRGATSGKHWRVGCISKLHGTNRCTNFEQHAGIWVVQHLYGYDKQCKTSTKH